MDNIRSSRAAFAAALIGIGVLGLTYGNACEIWEAIPMNLPGRPLLASLCSLVLLVFMLSWLVLLKLGSPRFRGIGRRSSFPPRSRAARGWWPIPIAGSRGWRAAGPPAQ